MKFSIVIVLALALISAITASPLLVTKHIIKKVVKAHHAGHHGKSFAPHVTEVHYVPVAAPVHPHGFKHY